VKPPKVERTNPKYLDEVQAAQVLELLESENMQYRVMVKLLLFIGFRRGELCGLEWDCVKAEQEIS
jgi:integrase